LRYYLCSLALLLSGCAYIGEPLPPSLKIPEKVADLKAFERGSHLVISFNLPSQATDGVPIRQFEDVDLRIGPALDSGRRIDAGVDEPAPVHLELPAREWAGQDVVIGVRAAARKGRYGEWSNVVRLRVVAPLGAPADLKAEPAPQGVRLSWRPAEPVPGLAWRVYRRAPGQKEPVLLGRAEQPQFIDISTQYGQLYEYEVQSVLKAGDAEAESDMSRPSAVTPTDTFPPAVPSSLAATAGVQNVQLSWTPNTDPDLKGYYVYRAAEGQDFQRAGDLTPTPAYTDRAVESGKRYRYAVSAVDQAGNESARSAPIEVTAQ
jgi:hypothetical protein